MLKQEITRLILLLLFCCFCAATAFAQPLGNFCGCFEKFVKFQDKIYAHDGEGIYYSEDLGETWQHTGISKNIVDLAANNGMLMYISFSTSVNTSPPLPTTNSYHNLHISQDGINFDAGKSLVGTGSLQETTSYTHEELVLLNDSTVYWFYAYHSARAASTERQASFFTNFGENERFEKHYFQNAYAFANGIYARPQKGATNYTNNADFTGYSFYPILGAPNEYPEVFFSFKNKLQAWFSNGQLFRTDTIHVWDSIPNIDLKGAFVSDGTVYKKTDDGIFKTLDDDFSDWKKVYGNDFVIAPNAEPAFGLFEEVLLINDGSCRNYRSLDEGITWMSSSAVSETDIFLEVCEGGIFSESGTYVEILTGNNGCDSIVTAEVTVHPHIETIINLQISRGDSVLGIPVFSDTTFVENFQTQIGCDSTVTTQVMISTSQNKNILTEKLKFTIYPNPHSQEAHLSFITKKHLIASIQLFDALGNHIFSDEFYHQENNSTYSIFEKNPHLPKGIYFLKIETEGQFFVEKIIRQ